MAVIGSVIYSSDAMMRTTLQSVSL